MHLASTEADRLFLIHVTCVVVHLAPETMLLHILAAPYGITPSKGTCSRHVDSFERIPDKCETKKFGRKLWPGSSAGNDGEFG